MDNAGEVRKSRAKKAKSNILNFLLTTCWNKKLGNQLRCFGEVPAENFLNLTRLQQ